MLSALAVLTVAIGIILEGDRVLIARRRAGGHLGGLWEFPGGKVGLGEAPVQALRRELEEELGVSVRLEARWTPIRHRYGKRHLVLHPFVCSIIAGKPLPKSALTLRWVPRQRIGAYRFPGANRRLLRRLARGRRI